MEQFVLWKFFSKNLIIIKLVRNYYFIQYKKLLKQNLSKLYNRDFKIFFNNFFGLSIIIWTVRAVNFLDIIVESGRDYLFLLISNTHF